MRISDWSSDVCSSDLMQACLDTVIPYLRERKQFGKPIGSFQLMQAQVADMYVALQSARAYTYAVAKACDVGQTTRFDAAGAILLASENEFRVAGATIGRANVRTPVTNAHLVCRLQF